MQLNLPQKHRAMKESYLFNMTFNNVVFAGRNKLYGAYELRKNYSKHVTLALIVATTSFAAGLSWPLLKPASIEEAITPAEKKPNKDIITVILADDILPPPKEQTLPEPQPTPSNQVKVKTIAHKTVKVVPNDHQGPEMNVPTEAQLKGAIIGIHTQEGDESSIPNLTGIENDNAGTGAGTGSDDANEVFEHVADMPSFEGGEEGLMRYISKRMKYPRQAVSEQIEGIVVVSFIVNQYGKVTEARVIKGLGYGTDEEALRVINSLPNWSPGKQNGKPVAVRYNLPIRFNLQR